MADMRQIFTYPNNVGTDYIDPDYIGNSTSGLTRRIDELLAGTYKAWTGLDPVSDLGVTTSGLMQKISEFNPYFAGESRASFISRYDFWDKPLVITTKELIADPSTIQSGDTLLPATIITTAPHNLEDGFVIRITGIDGSWASVIDPTTDYYAEVLGGSSLQVSRNEDLTDLIGFIGLQTFDTTTDAAAEKSSSSAAMAVIIDFNDEIEYPDATEVEINSVELNGKGLVNNPAAPELYVKRVTGITDILYYLYFDIDLLSPVTGSYIYGSGKGGGTQNGAGHRTSWSPTAKTINSTFSTPTGNGPFNVQYEYAASAGALTSTEVGAWLDTNSVVPWLPWTNTTLVAPYSRSSSVGGDYPLSNLYFDLNQTDSTISNLVYDVYTDRSLTTPLESPGPTIGLGGTMYSNYGNLIAPTSTTETLKLSFNANVFPNTPDLGTMAKVPVLLKTAADYTYSTHTPVDNTITGSTTFDTHSAPYNNLQQLEGKNVYLHAEPNYYGGNTFIGSLYYDYQGFQPITIASLDGSLFPNANNGDASFGLDPNNLYLHKENPDQYDAWSWYSKTGVEDFIPANTQVFMDNTTGTLYTDEAMTQVPYSQSFVLSASTPINWQQSLTDGGRIQIPERDFNLERINFISGLGSASTLPSDIYLTHVSGGSYAMYTNSARTIKVTPNNVVAGATNSAHIKDTGYNYVFGNGYNVVTSDVPLNPNDLVIKPEGEYQLSGSIRDFWTDDIMFNGNTWYYLEHVAGTSSPWYYNIYTDQPKTIPHGSAASGYRLWTDLAPFTDFDAWDVRNSPPLSRLTDPTGILQTNPALPNYNPYITITGPTHQGIYIPATSNTELNTDIGVGEINIDTVTGNGQTYFNGREIYKQGDELRSDPALTTPITAADISNDSAGGTKIFQFEPSGFSENGTWNNRPFLVSGWPTTPPSSADAAATRGPSFNSIRSVDGDVQEGGPGKGITSWTNGTWPMSKQERTGARRLDFSATDVADYDNAMMAQAGLLTDATSYYTNIVSIVPYTNNTTILSQGHLLKRWGLFEAIDTTSSSWTSGWAAGDYQDNFQQVPQFPEVVIEGGIRLNYDLYTNYPLDPAGNSITSGVGDIYDDGGTVILNDPVNHPTDFGWFFVTSYNNFTNGLAVNETVRLSPTQKIKYTGYLLNGNRLFESVDNSDTKVPVDLSLYGRTEVAVTPTAFLPDQYVSGYDNFASTFHQGYHSIPDTITLDKRKPYVFWDASNNIYIGMWTGKKDETAAVYPTPASYRKQMIFWTKAGWLADERHILDTAVPSTLYTGWFAQVPHNTRATADTFNFEDAFTFNNIVGVTIDTQAGAGGGMGGRFGAVIGGRENGTALWVTLTQDYSIDGTIGIDEPLQYSAQDPQPIGVWPEGSTYAPYALSPAKNLGAQQWMTTYDIVVPELQRHTLSAATSVLYVEEGQYVNQYAFHNQRESIVYYNANYNNNDTTVNPYYGYFKHGDIIDLPGVDGTGTASYVMIKRGSSDTLRMRWTTDLTPDPTGGVASNDITTEDITGEVWGVIPLADWTNSTDQGNVYNTSGPWAGEAVDNNEVWVPAYRSDGFAKLGPIQVLPMVSVNTTTRTYPGSGTAIYRSTGSIYTASCTVRAGNVATGTAYTNNDFTYSGSGETQTLDHQNKYKIIADTPWEMGDITGDFAAISQEVYNGPDSIHTGDILAATLENSNVRIQRYISSTEINDFYPYQGAVTAEAIPNLYRSQYTQTLMNMGDVNVTIGLPVSPATTGTISLSPNQPQPYRVASVDMFMPGNEVYQYQDTNNQTQPGAEVNPDNWYEATVTDKVTKTSGEIPATFNLTTDSNGRLTGVDPINLGADQGRYDSGNPQALIIDPKTNTYVPPVITPAEQADIYDTHDEWIDYGYAGGLKQWPHHVTPSSATINYSSPTMVNNSQSGVKYTRSSAHTKWVLEVEYPPMKMEEFQKFHAIAQAAQGQAMPFFFRLRNEDEVSILWGDTDEPGSALQGILVDPATAGDATLFIEGLTASDSQAFREGEVFIASQNENGALHTTTGAAASNAFGEAKVRMPRPLRTAMAQSELLYKNPAHCIVTLNSDLFEYSVDVNGYYNLTVGFDLDDWK